MNYKKPKNLKKGDTVAIVSSSWGGPSLFSHIYENGLKVLKEWGLKIKEMPSARKNADYLQANPKFRADDINNAFADKNIKAIFTSIGGDDSVRTLPFLNKKIIKNNPKILIGYSDTTILHTYCNINGIATFYGPSIMAGFSQMESLPSEFKQHVHNMLFNKNNKYTYQKYNKYCEGYPNWSKPTNIGKVNKFKNASHWNFIQGSGIAEGVLFGGCIEVLEFMKGTEFWPEKNFWNDKILFLETSEDKPSVNQVKYYLRNYGTQGIFNKISAILFGRARGYTAKEKQDLDKTIVDVVGGEFGCKNIPIVTNIDFGHTDPQFVLPLGIKACVDCKSGTFYLDEAWLA